MIIRSLGLQSVWSWGYAILNCVFNLVILAAFKKKFIYDY